MPSHTGIATPNKAALAYPTRGIPVLSTSDAPSLYQSAVQPKVSKRPLLELHRCPGDGRQVIVVDAIEHLGACGRSTDLSEVPVQLAFAGVTAIGGIRGVSRILQLSGHHLLVSDAQPLSLQPGFLTQVGAKAGEMPVTARAAQPIAPGQSRPPARCRHRRSRPHRRGRSGESVAGADRVDLDPPR